MLRSEKVRVEGNAVFRVDKVGSDFTGGDGEQNRTVTLDNTQVINTHIISIDKQTLSSDEYTVSGDATSATLTILLGLYDSQKVVVIYFQ